MLKKNLIANQRGNGGVASVSANGLAHEVRAGEFTAKGAARV